jgi:hypothetical protein
MGIPMILRLWSAAAGERLLRGYRHLKFGSAAAPKWTVVRLQFANGAWTINPKAKLSAVNLADNWVNGSYLIDESVLMERIR